MISLVNSFEAARIPEEAERLRPQIKAFLA